MRRRDPDIGRYRRALRVNQENTIRTPSSRAEVSCLHRITRLGATGHDKAGRPRPDHPKPCINGISRLFILGTFLFFLFFFSVSESSGQRFASRSLSLHRLKQRLNLRTLPLCKRYLSELFLDFSPKSGVYYDALCGSCAREKRQSAKDNQQLSHFQQPSSCQLPTHA